MKKLIALMLALSMLLCFAACGEKAEEPAGQDVPASTVAPAGQTEAPAAQTEAPAEQTAAPAAAPTPVPTPTPAPTPSQEQYQHYFDDVIKQYVTALSEGADRQVYYDRGLNSLVGAVNDASKVGYLFRDVNGDNIPELLIGCLGEKQIYALYALEGTSPKLVIDAGERNSFYLEPDNAIVNRGSSSAFLSAVMIYTLKGTALSLEVGLVSDFSVNEKEPWYRTYDEDWSVANDEKISNDFAETAVKAYEDNYVSLDYKAFSRFEG